MRIVEYAAAFYGAVTAYACLYLAGQWIADWLERHTCPRGHRA